MNEPRSKRLVISTSPVPSNASSFARLGFLPRNTKRLGFNVSHDDGLAQLPSPFDHLADLPTITQAPNESCLEGAFALIVSCNLH